MNINGTLTNKGLELNKNDLINKFTKEGLKKILKKFIIKYKSPIGTYYITKNLYYSYENTIVIPRFLAYKLLKLKIIDNIINTIEDGISINFNYIGKSNNNQVNIINYILSKYYNNENKKLGLCGVTLQLQAGMGKTFCAMDLISKINQKTLIIVPNTYLLKQWYELLIKYFPDNKIGQYYSKKKEDGDIVIGIINSITSNNFTFKKKKVETVYTHDEYFKTFGFIILDESHIYCTDIFKVVYYRFQSSYMLGLSATPNERTDKCDLISHANIGEVLDAVKIPDYIASDIKFTAHVDLIYYNAPDEYVKNHINPITEMISVPLIIEDLVNDQYRNKLILQQLLELFDQQLNIFVFSERRNHLEYLYTEFSKLLENKYTENLSIPELNINSNLVLYGGSSDDEIKKAQQVSKVIFTTYSYSSTGVSINKMNAVILSTPRKSKARQIIGRIFRLNNENNHIKRIIIDIIDNKSVLKNQLYHRMSAYKERESTIEKKIINYSDL
jgi:superfamily II DNA or RNA helicase